MKRREVTGKRYTAAFRRASIDDPTSCHLNNNISSTVGRPPSIKHRMATGVVHQRAKRYSSISCLRS